MNDCYGYVPDKAMYAQPAQFVVAKHTDEAADPCWLVVDTEAWEVLDTYATWEQARAAAVQMNAQM